MRFQFVQRMMLVWAITAVPVLFLSSTTFVTIVGNPAVVMAQDGDGEVAADDINGNEEAAPKKSWLRWAFGALGIGFSLVFLALSFTFVALLVMNLLVARRET